MNGIENLRYEIGDTTEPYIFTDEQLQSYLDDFNGNISLCAYKLRPIMLVNLSQYVREREGNVEVYGGERSSNFKKALDFLTSAPKNAMPIVGGVRRDKNLQTDLDPNSVNGSFYIGMFS